MINKLHILFLSFIMTFLLSACGGGGGDNGGTTNHAPVLSAISNVSMIAGNSQTISLTATDQDNDAVSFNVSGGSALTVNATISGNSLTITPAPGYVTASPITFTATASDGKGGTDSKTFSVTVTTQTKAILKVSTANIPAGTLVGAIQAAFTLPSGTFLATDSVTGEVSNGVVTLSGVANGSLTAPSYNPASRLVSFGIVNAAGFGNGEILTITVSITSGIMVQASDFPSSAATSPAPLQIIDVINLNPIAGATCPITVTSFQ